MNGENPDFAQEDLCNAIENGDFPKWTMYIQSNDRRASKRIELESF